MEITFGSVSYLSEQTVHRSVDSVYGKSALEDKDFSFAPLNITYLQFLVFIVVWFSKKIYLFI